jgi:plastocyanin
MKRQLLILISAAFLLVTLSAKATIVVITQQDLTFNPATVSVNVGDTIRWVWTAGDHTTTSATIPDGAQAWDSPLTATSPQFDYVVTVEGTYNYVCTPHAAAGMVGSFTATGTLGIGDRIDISSVKVYPNPAKDRAVLVFSAAENSVGHLAVYDLLGNQISTSEVIVNYGTNSIDLPVNQINPGIYFVELKYADQSAIVRRFVKSR